MHLQRAALELEQARQFADQHLRWLDAIYSDILEARSARVSPDITLGEILDGDADASQVERKRFAGRLESLLQLVVQYCQAVNLYRDDISEFFDARIYTDRGGRLLDSIKPVGRGEGVDLLDEWLVQCRSGIERKKESQLLNLFRGFGGINQTGLQFAGCRYFRSEC